MATLNATNLKHASSGSNNIVLAADGSTTISNLSGGVGKILQVVQTVKTDTASESVGSGSFTSTVYLPTNITPSSTSSKVLITVSICLQDYGQPYIALQRDGSPICVGDADGNRRRVTSGTYMFDSISLATVNAQFLDSPNTTSQVTYGVKLAVRDNNTSTIYINRTESNNNYSYAMRGASTLIVQEVAA
jgi:hypothetical protein